MPNFLYSAKNYTNRKEWLKGRRNSIGASEIAVVMGISHFKTPDELWREKRGEAEPPDLSDNDRVQYGTEAEEYLRKLFALKHRREYGMSYHPFKVFYRTDTPYLTCTLDGELQRYSDGSRGIYECKTALIESKRAEEEWKGNHIPQHYYTQLLQQHHCTGWKFAVLNAELRYPDNSAQIKEYYIEFDGLEDDVNYVVEEGKAFWNCVETGKMPKYILTL